MLPDTETDSGAALGVALGFFDALEKEGIGCCHWKSNQHLREALRGKTDLDVLVGEADAKRCTEILLRLGFKRMVSVSGGGYPGIEDWLGFDDRAGRLVHVHLHYALIMGDDRLKNCLLPAGAWLLTDCRRQEGIPVPQIEKELIVLLLRIILKADYKTLIRPLYKRRKFPFPDSVRAELDWLLERYEPERLPGALEESGLKLGLDPFLELIRLYEGRRLTGLALWRIKVSIRPDLKPYRRYSGWAFWRRLLAAHLRTSRLARRFCRSRKKRLEGRGLYMALVGPDGSGKSRLANDLKRWLRWKLDVTHLYFGIPRRNARYRVWSRLWSLAGSLKKRSERLRLTALARVWARCQQRIGARRWLWLARRRLELHERAGALAEEGAVVIAERFPLREFWSMKEPMDGPRIPAGEDGLPEWLAASERALYEQIGLPDRVCVLRVGLGELRRRKDDLALEAHREKAEAVNRLGGGGRYTLIDGEAAYDDVLLAVKRQIWRDL